MYSKLAVGLCYIHRIVDSLLMLNSEAENVNLSVVGTLVIVTHLKEGPGRAEVLLQGFEWCAVKRELKRVVLVTQLVVESAARSN